MWDLRTRKLLRQIKWTDSQHYSELSSIYSVKFVKPYSETILACGSNKNAAKLLGVSSGQVLFDLKDSQEDIGKSPVILVDSAPNGKSGLVGAANGKLFVKNILVAGSSDEDGDSDISP